MTRAISGRLFAAGTNSSIKAELNKRGNQILITLEEDESGRVTSFSTKIVHVSDRLANVARKIELEDGAMFETLDNDGVDSLLGYESNFFVRMTRAESSLKVIVVSVVCTVVVLMGLYRYGLPALANGAAKITPPGVLSLMDNGTLSTVDRVLFNPSKLGSARKKEITGLFGELAKQSGQENMRLLFRDGGVLGANAIALPGGTVIITDQLIGLAKSDNEIAGVLAHEIGHVELRHSLRQIYRVLGLGFMITIIGGDSGQLVEDVIAQAVALESLSYSRSFEIESDHRSAQLMIELGRDPLAFLKLLQRVTKDEQKEGTSDWYATHPGTFNRKLIIEKYVKSIQSSQ